MDYATFKNYIIELSWRSNDAALSTSLDNLILSAHGELNSILRVPDMDVNTTITPTSEDYTLPSDFFTMDQLYGTDLNRGEFLKVPEGELRHVRETSKSQTWHPIYSIVGTTLLLCGPVDTQSGTPFNITYQRTMPDYQGTDTSWLADKYLHIYEAAVMKRVAIWAREDERIQFYSSLLGDSVKVANEQAAWGRKGHRRADTPLPRPASASHRFNNRVSRRGFKVRGY